MIMIIIIIVIIIIVIIIYQPIITITITALVSQHLPLEILQIDQRGGSQGVMGCLDNTLIDKLVLEDAKINKKNLSMVGRM